MGCETYGKGQKGTITPHAMPKKGEHRAPTGTVKKTGLSYLEMERGIKRGP